MYQFQIKKKHKEKKEKDYINQALKRDPLKKTEGINGLYESNENNGSNAGNLEPKIQPQPNERNQPKQNEINRLGNKEALGYLLVEWDKLPEYSKEIKRIKGKIILF